eukprot:233911-Rhodomonas_salina.1
MSLYAVWTNSLIPHTRSQYRASRRVRVAGSGGGVLLFRAAVERVHVLGVRVELDRLVRSSGRTTIRCQYRRSRRGCVGR